MKTANNQPEPAAPNSAPSSIPLFDNLSETQRAALNAQCDFLDKKGWAFDVSGNAAVALALVSIYSRTMRDPQATPDEQAVARFFIAFFYGLFSRSPYIQAAIARACPHVLADAAGARVSHVAN